MFIFFCSSRFLKYCDFFFIYLKTYFRFKTTTKIFLRSRYSMCFYYLRRFKNQSLDSIHSPMDSIFHLESNWNKVPAGRQEWGKKGKKEVTCNFRRRRKLLALVSRKSRTLFEHGCLCAIFLNLRRRIINNCYNKIINNKNNLNRNKIIIIILVKIIEIVIITRCWRTKKPDILFRRRQLSIIFFERKTRIKKNILKIELKNLECFQSER